MPLTPHYNPHRISHKENSLGAFPNSLMTTSFFCNNRFRVRYIILIPSYGININSQETFPLNHAKQATLQYLKGNCRLFSNVNIKLHLNLHGNWVYAHMPLWIAQASLTPRINPQLGVSSQPQGLHMYALNGFLAPFS